MRSLHAVYKQQEHQVHDINRPAETDTKVARIARHLQKHLSSRGEGLHHYALRGAATRFGSYAAGLIVVWLQTKL